MEQHKRDSLLWDKIVEDQKSMELQIEGQDKALNTQALALKAKEKEISTLKAMDVEISSSP